MELPCRQTVARAGGSGYVELCVVAAMLFGGVGTSMATEIDNPDRLNEIVENVSAGEALYSHIEFVITRTMRLGNPKYRTDRALQLDVAKSRVIRQSELLYFNEDHRQEQVTAATKDFNTRQGYDGSLTRTVEQNAVATIQHKRSEAWTLPRPHTLLFRRSWVGFPLSRYLQGERALHGDPSVGDFATWHLAIHYRGEDTVAGLSCVKVETETWSESRPRDKAERALIWLATDRNYLPVRREIYNPLLDPDFAFSVGTVDEMREVSPGLWFPIRATSTTYDNGWWHEAKNAVPSNTDTFVIEVVSVDPHYDISLFRDIPIPDGAIVHEIVDDKIVKSWRHSAPEAPTSRYVSLPLSIGIVIAIAAVAIALELARRVRRSRRSRSLR